MVQAEISHVTQSQHTLNGSHVAFITIYNVQTHEVSKNKVVTYLSSD